jgi:quercetin dioxygenase-like cupin family protein
MAFEPLPDELDDEQRNEATFYALELLGPVERRAFGRRLSSSPALRGEVGTLREAATRLAEAIPPVRPPSAVKARLLARVRAEASPAPGLHERRAQEGPFEPTGIPGVSLKQLRHDPASGLSTMLVRMEPGASYPAHRHALAEQCLVLQGDLRCGESAYDEGDFLWADEGSEHPMLHTVRGNLLLIVGSESNELCS